MTRHAITRRMVLLAAAALAVVLLAGAHGAANTDAAPPVQSTPTQEPMTLPIASNITLKEGLDRDLVASTCMQCHTAKPIVTHDGFSTDTWAAEVQKMRTTYGCPMDDATAQRITVYLQTYYSGTPPSPEEMLTGETGTPAATPAASPVASPAASPLASPAAGG